MHLLDGHSCHISSNSRIHTTSQSSLLQFVSDMPTPSTRWHIRRIGSRKLELQSDRFESKKRARWPNTMHTSSMSSAIRSTPTRSSPRPVLDSSLMCLMRVSEKAEIQHHHNHNLLLMAVMHLVVLASGVRLQHRLRAQRHRLVLGARPI